MRKRVLLSAFGFSPYRGSECAVGWNIACELAKLHDVTVITGDVKEIKEYAEEYDKYVSENGTVDGLSVIYLRPTWLIKFIERLHDKPGLWSLYYLAYNLWQRQAYKLAKKLHCEQPFDVVHHLNMIGFREPGYMWKLDAPFFWGPVGGSVNEPLSFSAIYSKTGAFKALIRSVINEAQKRLLLRPQKAARVAKQIWAVSPADVETINKVWKCDCEQMVESAVTLVAEAKVHFWDGVGSFRIVWSGTHTYGKAMPILIHAVAMIKHSSNLNSKTQTIYVDVLGKGEETLKWKDLAEKCGVAECFNWIGYVPRQEALKIMNKAHCLVFTSVKEGTPHVVMEALSLGLPVLCHDACGMEVVVNEKCGIKIPMVSPKDSIEGFAAAIKLLIGGTGRVEELSKGAIERAAQLTWESKARKFSEAYESK